MPDYLQCQGQKHLALYNARLFTMPRPEASGSLQCQTIYNAKARSVWLSAMPRPVHLNWLQQCQCQKHLAPYKVNARPNDYATETEYAGCWGRREPGPSLLPFAHKSLALYPPRFVVTNWAKNVLVGNYPHAKKK